MLEPQSDQGWEKQLTHWWVGRQPSLALGLSSCVDSPLAGAGEGGRQEQEPPAGLPAPTPPPSFGVSVPAYAQPTASSPSGGRPPTSLPILRAQPCPGGRHPICADSRPPGCPDSGSPGRGDRQRGQPPSEEKQKPEPKEGTLEPERLVKHLAAVWKVLAGPCLSFPLCREDANISRACSEDDSM